jgi:hypothetical protein
VLGRALGDSRLHLIVAEAGLTNGPVPAASYRWREGWALHVWLLLEGQPGSVQTSPRAAMASL